MLKQGVTVIEGRYFQDLMAQPAALEATLDWLRGAQRRRAVRDFLTSRQWKRIVLTGMGSSFHVFHPLNLRLIETGATPVLMETAELIHYGHGLLDEDTLLIAASQSGRSAETLRLLEVNRRSAMLAITNTPDSPLARASQCLLLTQAGEETSVSCKTYVSMLLVVRWLAGVIGGEHDSIRLLEPCVSLVDQYLRGWREHIQQLAKRLHDTRDLFLIGRGPSLAAVGTGALIIKESVRLHAEGLSSAAFRHGPMEMLDSDLRAVVFSGEPRTRELNRQLIRDLLARGGRCDEIGVDAPLSSLRLPDSVPAIWPILEILPVQMMTLTLAALAGKEAGLFQHATKVTAVE